LQTTPDILAYADPRDFLRAAISAHSESFRGFGLREISAKAGFSSPSTLSMILSRKRKLNPRIAEKLAEALGLSGRRRQVLILFAELESARSIEDRHRIQERLLKVKCLSEENLLSLQQYRVLAVWYYPVIYALVGMDSFRRRPEWIAKRLGGGVSPLEVKRALGDLLNLGLIEDRNGKLVQTKGALTTEPQVKSMAIRRYHQQMLRLASASIDLPAEQRELNGLTVPIPVNRLPEIKEKIRKFRHELNQYLSQFNDATDVYQFNMQLFALTQPAPDEGDE